MRHSEPEHTAGLFGSLPETAAVLTHRLQLTQHAFCWTSSGGLGISPPRYVVTVISNVEWKLHTYNLFLLLQINLFRIWILVNHLNPLSFCLSKGSRPNLCMHTNSEICIHWKMCWSYKGVCRYRSVSVIHCDTGCLPIHSVHKH